MMNFVLAA